MSSMSMSSMSSDVPYNAKINTNGEYRNFYGWTVISMVENDLKFIENFIKNSMLKNYFSALPSSSYHMTVYNVWSNGRKLLPHQKDFIKKNFPAAEHKQIEAQSKTVNFFNPKGCINDLLYKLYFICEQSQIVNLTLNVKEVVFTGNTIQILFVGTPSFDGVNRLRQLLTDVCEVEDRMGMYHMTLAYKYKDVDNDTTQKIMGEIDRLNVLLNGQTVTMEKPSVYYFSDMKEFVPVSRC